MIQITAAGARRARSSAIAFDGVGPPLASTRTVRAAAAIWAVAIVGAAWLAGRARAGAALGVDDVARTSREADAARGAATAPTSVPIVAIDFDALFVVNGGDDSISVIDTSRGEVAGTIALRNARYPHHLSLSPDRAKLALAAPGVDFSKGHAAAHGEPSSPAAVLLLDATTGATLAARALPAMNHNAAFSPCGTEIWTTQMASLATVLVLDAAHLETQRAIAVGAGASEVTFSENGKLAFVANGGADAVTVIDVDAKTVVKTIAVGKGPVGVWVASNGTAYVDDEAGRSLTAIDTATLEVKRTYVLGFAPAVVALAPDGDVWVADPENGRIVRYAPDSDVVRGEIVTGAGAHAIVFAGTATGYVSNQAAGTVSVVDVASRRVMKTIPVGEAPNGMVWRSR